MQDPWSLAPWSAKYPLAQDTTDFMDDIASAEDTVVRSVASVAEPQNFVDIASADDTVIRSVAEQAGEKFANSIVHNPTMDVEPWDFTEREFVKTNSKRNFKKYRPSSSKPSQKIEEKQTLKTKTKKESKYVFRKKESVHRVECASNYDAIDETKTFGLIYNDSTLGGYMSFTIHSRKTTPMFKSGDSLSIVKRDGGRGVVKFGFVGRSKYVQPGRPIRSMIVGVSTEDWKRLTN